MLHRGCCCCVLITDACVAVWLSIGCLASSCWSGLLPPLHGQKLQEVLEVGQGVGDLVGASVVVRPLSASLGLRSGSLKCLGASLILKKPGLVSYLAGLLHQQRAPSSLWRHCYYDLEFDLRPSAGPRFCKSRVSKCGGCSHKFAACSVAIATGVASYLRSTGWKIFAVTYVYFSPIAGIKQIMVPVPPQWMTHGWMTPPWIAQGRMTLLDAFSLTPSPIPSPIPPRHQ